MQVVKTVDDRGARQDCGAAGWSSRVRRHRRRRNDAAGALASLLSLLLLLPAVGGQPAAAAAAQDEAAAPASERETSSLRAPPVAPLLRGPAAAALLSAPSRATALAGAAERHGVLGGGARLLEALRSDSDLNYNPDTGALVWLERADDDDGEHDDHHHGVVGGGGGGGGVGDGGRGGHEPPLSALAAAASSVQQPPAPLDSALEPSLADAFSLHSRPGAKWRLLLDFTGHTHVPYESGTWSNAVNASAPISAPPYSVDSDPGSFSDEERRRIIATHRAVAEDWLPFDIDVTTDEGPMPAGQQLGARVVIGGTSADWLLPAASGSLGGAAPYGGWGVPRPGDGEPEPAWVFAHRQPSGGCAPASCAARTPKRMAEIASHEAGHTFGLRHQGRLTPGEGSGAVETYRGHGIWAPIMGTAYDRPVTQWSKGEYSGAYWGAYSPADEIQAIRSLASPAPDDHGDAPASATRLAPGGYARGVVGVEGDVDVFKIPVSLPGTLTLRLDVLDSPPSGGGHSSGDGWSVAGSNLNAQVTLRLPNGTEATWRSAPPSSPASEASLLSGSWAVAVPEAGDCYVFVRAAPLGASPDEGFTAYGSAGRYSLGATLAPAPLSCAPARRFELPLPGTTCFDPQPLPAAGGYFSPGAYAPTVSGLPATLARGTRTYTLSTTAGGGSSCSLSITASGCGPCAQFKLSASGGAIDVRRNGKWRVKDAVLRLADSTGAMPAGIDVVATWTHVPAAGARAAKTKTVRASTSTRAAARAGGVASSSQLVPPGGALRLDVAAASGRAGAGCSWLRSAGDTATFTCTAAGCQ